MGIEVIIAAISAGAILAASILHNLSQRRTINALLAQIQQGVPIKGNVLVQESGRRPKQIGFDTPPSAPPLSSEAIKGWLAALTQLSAANAVRTVNITEPSALANLVAGISLSLERGIEERDKHTKGSPEWKVHDGAVLAYRNFIRVLVDMHESLLESYRVAGAELESRKKGKQQKGS